MPTKTFALSALTAALLACHSLPAGSPTPAALPPFQAPPGTLAFAVRGSFFGTLRLTADTLYVHVDSGAVKDEVPAEQITLAAAIAVHRGDQWHILATSEDQSVIWIPRTWTPLADSAEFAIHLPPHFNPAQNWLLFQFTIHREGKLGATYAHASTMLNGAPRTVGPGL